MFLFCYVCAKASQVGIDFSGHSAKQGSIKKKKNEKRVEEGRSVNPFMCGGHARTGKGKMDE